MTFSTEQTADYLHCSPAQVTALIRRGELKAAKIGRSYAVKQEWLDEFLEAKAQRDFENAKVAAVLPAKKVHQRTPDLSRYLGMLQ